MPYLNPFRRLGDPDAHEVKIISNEPTSYPVGQARAVGASVYQFKVVCKCQFEALATTQEQADFYVRSHKKAHGLG